MIEYVIEVRSELCARRIGQPHGSRKRHVDVADAGPADHVSPAVPERAGCGDLKCFRIKETRCRRLISIRISDKVGPIHNGTSGPGHIRAHNRRQRRPRLHRSDYLELPTFSDRKTRAGQAVCTGKNEAVSHIEVRKPAFATKVVRVLREDADQSRVVDRAGEPVRRDKSNAGSEPPLCPHFRGMRDRKRACLELEDVLESRKRPPLIQRLCRAWGRLIEIELAAKPGTLLAEVGKVH